MIGLATLLCLTLPPIPVVQSKEKTLPEIVLGLVWWRTSGRTLREKLSSRRESEAGPALSSGRRLYKLKISIGFHTHCERSPSTGKAFSRIEILVVNGRLSVAQRAVNLKLCATLPSKNSGSTSRHTQVSRNRNSQSKMVIDYSKVNPDSHLVLGKDWKNTENKDGTTNGLLRKGILRTDALQKYIMETSVYPREHKALKGLREATEKHAWGAMAATGDVGQLLGMLLRLLNAKNTIELGVFTGYSLLATALALPEDGKVVAADINRDSYNIGVPYLEEAGVAHKVDFREGKCLDTLETLLSEEKNHGLFDFAFVDADKENFVNYHVLLLKLVRVGGMIAYDNTLWGGSVVDVEGDHIPDHYLGSKPAILELNKYLAADSNVEICQLSISDGVTLCRRLV